MGISPLSGEDGFLASRHALQQALLPYLTAKDLFSLSCTCKAVQQWLLSTPPSTWQV